MLPDFRYRPLEELAGNELDHVAAERIHSPCCPEEQDVAHLVPGARVEGTIVQFDGIIPVVPVGGWAEAVAGCLGGILGKTGPVRQAERLAGVVIEVVFRFPMGRVVVAVAQVGDVGPDPVTAVIAAHMIGDEVEDKPESGLVRPLDERLEFGHPFLFVIS